MPIVTLVALCLFTAIAAFTDHRTGHIPNPLVATLAVAGVALQLVLGLWGQGTVRRGVGDALANATFAAALGVVLCAMVPLLLYKVGAMGGGDVKLLGAIGLAAGPMLGLEIELTAFVVAVLYAGARLAYRGELLRLLGNSLALATNPMRAPEKRRPVPEALMTSLRFAPAVFAATLLSVLAHWGET
ncbi:MAG TPA: A24 family peptidase [Polyangiaceae bacterium]|jgi:prepilin peptidase CpaA|nr:A24 family peptidase [Polyangiaceae bacterium]